MAELLALRGAYEQMAEEIGAMKSFHFDDEAVAGKGRGRGRVDMLTKWLRVKGVKIGRAPAAHGRCAAHHRRVAAATLGLRLSLRAGAA
jgi:hypothetical protein